MEYNSKTKGLVHLYVGDGKGKTTAAMGLAVRAVGSGKRVWICQFLKGRDTGEVASLEKLGIPILRVKSCDKFTFQMTPQEFAMAQCLHMELLKQAYGLAKSGNLDLIILDELVDAVNAQIVPLEDVVALITQRDPRVELVLSGRNPPEALCQLADYHTLFQCVRHPYQQGVPAREGVEF